MPSIPVEELYLTTPARRTLVEQVRTLAAACAARAPEHDRAGSFPHENFADIRKAGLAALTVPTRWGGAGGGVLETVVTLVELGRGDGATALCLSWHLKLLGKLAETGAWPAAIFERVCRDVAQRGALLNSIASEPATGSPSRGGRPATVATRTEKGWRIDGRKTFSSLAPALDYFVTLCSVADPPAAADDQPADERAWFLVPAAAPGLRIVETWDTMGMRASGSHDTVYEGVEVGEDALVEWATPGRTAGAKGGAGWDLATPAVYLGVARAAADFAIGFARRHAPNSLKGQASIGELPHIQALLGEMERHLLTSLTLLYTWADAYDRAPLAQRLTMGPAFAGAKSQITNAAIAIVDLAMRVVGGAGLSRKLPLERYYRDVRAGLHHPPMDDTALAILARAALEVGKSDAASGGAALP